jgi:hypothetical protein
MVEMPPIPREVPVDGYCATAYCAPPTALLVTALSQLVTLDAALQSTFRFSELEFENVKEIVSTIEAGLEQVATALDQTLRGKLAEIGSAAAPAFASLAQSVIERICAFDTQLSQQITRINRELTESEGCTEENSKSTAQISFEELIPLYPESLAERVAALGIVPIVRSELGRKLGAGNLQAASVLARRALVTAKLLPECEHFLRVPLKDLAQAASAEVQNVMGLATSTEHQGNGLHAGVVLHNVAQSCRRLEALVERVLLAPRMSPEDRSLALAAILKEIVISRATGAALQDRHGLAQATATLASYKLDQIKKMIEAAA